MTSRQLACACIVGVYLRDDPLTTDQAVHAARCPKRSQIVTKHHRVRVTRTVGKGGFRQRSVSRRERLGEALANLLMLVGRQGLEPWTR